MWVLLLKSGDLVACDNLESRYFYQTVSVGCQTRVNGKITEYVSEEPLDGKTAGPNGDVYFATSYSKGAKRPADNKIPGDLWLCSTVRTPMLEAYKSGVYGLRLTCSVTIDTVCEGLSETRENRFNRLEGKNN